MNDGFGRTKRRRQWDRAVWGASTRLLALLWLFAAVLAMPLVASAQLVASGTGAFLRPGDVSGRENRDGRAAEPALSRQALRAAQPADVRFTAERIDAKPVPGGPDPLSLAVFRAPDLLRPAAFIATAGRSHRLDGGVSEAAEARAPPALAPSRR
ncbi:hypothetical protein ASG39_08035 [Rhizobium sp. Leaf371]|uniref:hypothetical protein n=1 Tax=unclassified Rhizobium TaxID=2613769 RepID=UPI000712CD21|nr:MULTISPECIES: hypothetical protein [unclassified Rhizobium]KQS65200.1 hypothetical protein ASG39_08035 [Rhizobium sp. Leaf371]TCM56095.1 hypothetical protein C8J36_103465 [Rhizobium sp. PP-F2F-G48]